MDNEIYSYETENIDLADSSNRQDEMNSQVDISEDEEIIANFNQSSKIITNGFKHK